MVDVHYWHQADIRCRRHQVTFDRLQTAYSPQTPASVVCRLAEILFYCTSLWRFSSAFSNASICPPTVKLAGKAASNPQTTAAILGLWSTTRMRSAKR